MNFIDLLLLIDRELHIIFFTKLPSLKMIICMKNQKPLTDEKSQISKYPEGCGNPNFHIQITSPRRLKSKYKFLNEIQSNLDDIQKGRNY